MFEVEMVLGVERRAIAGAGVGIARGAGKGVCGLLGSTQWSS
jgi:hypothetical protein